MLAAGVLFISKQLDPVERQRDLRIDLIGFGLVGVAISLISIGFNYVSKWGVLLAAPTAPFGVLGLSPAPVMIVVGIVLGQAFFVWSRRRQAKAKMPLMSPQVIETKQQRSAVFSMFMIVMLGSAISFLIPLYIEIVQGRSSLETALGNHPLLSIDICRSGDGPGPYRPGQSSRTDRPLSFVDGRSGLHCWPSSSRNEWEHILGYFRP